MSAEHQQPETRKTGSSSERRVEAGAVRGTTSAVSSGSGGVARVAQPARPRRSNWFATAVVASLGVGAFGFSYYYVLSRRQDTPFLFSERPLPKQAAIRGQYLNTGSADIGPDPTYRERVKALQQQQKV
jgi:hypothetical protein